jgi:hypothetical protein
MAQHPSILGYAQGIRPYPQHCSNQGKLAGVFCRGLVVSFWMAFSIEATFLGKFFAVNPFKIKRKLCTSKIQWHRVNISIPKGINLSKNRGMRQKQD